MSSFFEHEWNYIVCFFASNHDHVHVPIFGKIAYVCYLLDTRNSVKNSFQESSLHDFQVFGAEPQTSIP